MVDAKRLLTGGELAEFRWTVGEYIACGRKNALDGAWAKQLENASARVHISRLEALQVQIQQQAEVLYANQLDGVDAAIREMYLGSYYGTTFEVQRGLGIGWTLHAINEKTIQKVLSRPWTADNLTFRDRCWTNKQDLVNNVNTQLTQMIIRGEAPGKAIKAISHQFKVSKAKAGRLVMTESAAFSSAAQKDCYRELGVEQFKVVAALDGDTCELCGALDSKVFKMSEYQVGLTAPPFHPWCRCCTCPYFEDIAKLGERWTRNPDDTTEKVPADMSFDEWKGQFVKDEPESGVSEIFRPMGDYIRADGSFDVEIAKADYEKFLQSVPEKNRIYLEQSMNAVEYEQRKLKRSLFGYSVVDDIIYYDPANPGFADFSFDVVNTHELAHRIDHTMFIESWESEAFSTAIAGARDAISADPQKFLTFANEDSKGFLSDILSAICEQDYNFPVGHTKSYWQKPGNKQRDTFANLFSLESFRDEEALRFLQKNFPGLLEAYQKFWS